MKKGEDIILSSFKTTVPTLAILALYHRIASCDSHFFKNLLYFYIHFILIFILFLSFIRYTYMRFIKVNFKTYIIPLKKKYDISFLKEEFI